ncbi:MAG: tail fiber domain-containing protein, partial [Candidatus Omnitrophota bacterium]|nr:tail fiber domain-containing protein [Candidatus Omnitrophota bacterium]MBU1929263.1 tail fiber domain-containing protein [Candidatus Omnitrophota bacterium]MBU2035285.1 tail fiber domain-containing protein [Candidatus Omnitrophota bacterium]MBU2221183.1 tail fiber domain-containing protein [Candidatus Omnitrophota bacterium]
AFAEETITITTYYPSPYGSYYNLTASNNVTLANVTGSRVGIGTATPGTKLHVFQDQTTIPDNIALVTLESGGTATGGKGRVLDVYTTRGDGFTDGYIAQFRNSASTKMYIRGDGRVGIGQTNPGAALDVNGAIKASSGFAGPMYFSGSVGGSGWLAGIGTGAAASNPNSISIDTLETMRQASGAMDGTLEVFHYYPGQTLRINGATWCTSGSWSGSDIRWKKNISTLNNPLPKLLRLRGVTFEWKNQEETNTPGLPAGKQIGIIAQEIEKEFPELVSTDKDGYKAFSYDKFTAVLLEAIKEQQKEIQEQQNEIKDLKFESAQQKAEIAGIKNKL